MTQQRVATCPRLPDHMYFSAPLRSRTIPRSLGSGANLRDTIAKTAEYLSQSWKGFLSLGIRRLIREAMREQQDVIAYGCA